MMSNLVANPEWQRLPAIPLALLLLALATMFLFRGTTATSTKPYKIHT